MTDEQIQERNDELFSTLNHSKSESDRGLVLITAAHLDDCLRRLLESFLIESSEVEDLFEGPSAPFGTLSSKTKAAYVMGLIKKDEMKRIDAIRRVRNVFAHVTNASFAHPDIKKLCAGPPIYDGINGDRDAFLHMAQNTVLPILYRDLAEGKDWRRKELT